MSRRTADANKAVRLAWERERALVKEGKGTRDWTEEQQLDILNPEKGKAYDENGIAFEGQHMRSVEAHPEYQGNPDNIQFLSKAEHLEAHKGNFQNPTNWYYNPITKEYLDFGDGNIIPCTVIQLSKPVLKIPNTKPNDSTATTVKTDKKEEKSHSTSNSVEHIRVEEVGKKTGGAEAVKGDSKFVKGLKIVGRFIVEHPVESLEIVGVAVVGVAKIVTSVNNGTRASGTNSNKSNENKSTYEKEIKNKVIDIIEKADRAKPCEHEVSEHTQRYHNKDGIITRNIDKYSRGGKS